MDWGNQGEGAVGWCHSVESTVVDSVDRVAAGGVASGDAVVHVGAGDARIPDLTQPSIVYKPNVIRSQITLASRRMSCTAYTPATPCPRSQLAESRVRHPLCSPGAGERLISVVNVFEEPSSLQNSMIEFQNNYLRSQATIVCTAARML